MTTVKDFAADFVETSHKLKNPLCIIICTAAGGMTGNCLAEDIFTVRKRVGDMRRICSSVIVEGDDWKIADQKNDSWKVCQEESDWN